MNPRIIRRYGWRRDTPDHRDQIYNLQATILQPHQLPTSVDLVAVMPPVYDQLKLGSCTSHAAAALLERAEMRQNEGTVTPSRLFIYYETRRLEGMPPSEDTGGEVRTAIKVLITEGAPAETDWPYSDANPGPFQDRPPQQAYDDAAKHEALAYQRILIGPGAPMRTALANGLPIAFGFPVPANFEDPAWDPSADYLRLPTFDVQIIGGHAVVVVGYDYTRRRFPVPVFKIRNSWGAEWGEQGHFWMDSRWFDPYRNLADDLWVVQTVT